MMLFESLFSSCTNERQSRNKTFEDWTKLPDDIKDSATRLKLGVCLKSYNRNVKEAKKGSFEYWNSLPNELRQLIISKMEYRTRFKLSLCSKSDFHNVNKTKIRIYQMEILEKPNSVILKIFFNHQKTGSVFIEMVEKEGKCYLALGRKVDVSNIKYVLYKNEDYRMVALDVAAKFLQRSNFQITRLHLLMDSPILQSMFTNSLKYITEFYIETQDYEYLLWWVRSLGPLDDIYIKWFDWANNCDMTELFERVQKCKSNSITFYANSFLTEKQFLSLNLSCFVVVISNESILTARCINKYIEQWKNGKLRDDFSYISIVIQNGFDEDELLEGLEAKEWDEEFRKESKTFCDAYIEEYEKGTFYEVLNDDKDRAATLHIDGCFVNCGITGILKEGRMVHTFYY